MRHGQSIQTFSGLPFWPIDPRVEEVRIEDIAHSLSLQCRFAGHTRKFYSVAQHSVLVANIVPIPDALWGLLHDASEAYLVDLPAPIKKFSRLGEEYQVIEKDIMSVIAERFGLCALQPESVHHADMTLRVTEMRDLMSFPDIPKELDYNPLLIRIEPWSAEEAEAIFLANARLLIASS